MKVDLKYDREADAAYLRFSRADVIESEEVAPGVILDFDAEGHIVGLEVLQARKHLSRDTLVAAE